MKHGTGHSDTMAAIIDLVMYNQMSYVSIAKELGMKERTVLRYLRKLERNAYMYKSLDIEMINKGSWYAPLSICIRVNK